MVLAGCGGTSEKNTPEVSPTPWSAPFQAHLSEYLDPAWTSQPIESLGRCWRREDGDLEGYINGKLIVLSVDTGQLLPLPDAGLWADTPEEVGTVVLVWAIKTEDATYWDGTKGYREDWGVKLVDLEKRAVVGDAYILGDSPPTYKSGPGDVTGLPPYNDTVDALRARLFAEPFQGHLSEYLDPAWTTQPIEWSHLNGYINGKLIVVSADTGQLLRPSYSQKSHDSNEPGPPDWGLPWADTPEEVGAVVIVWAIQGQESTYMDGAAAYSEDFMVKLVYFETKTVVGEGSEAGEISTFKSCPGDEIGGSPWADLWEDLRALPTSPESGTPVAGP